MSCDVMLKEEMSNETKWSEMKCSDVKSIKTTADLQTLWHKQAPILFI